MVIQKNLYEVVKFDDILTTAEAHVSPAPKATNAKVSPAWMRPCSIASQKAIGTDAADVLA